MKNEKCSSNAAPFEKWKRLDGLTNATTVYFEEPNNFNPNENAHLVLFALIGARFVVRCVHLLNNDMSKSRAPRQENVYSLEVY